MIVNIMSWLCIYWDSQLQSNFILFIRPLSEVNVQVTSVLQVRKHKLGHKLRVNQYLKI